MAKIQSNPFAHLDHSSMPSFGGLTTISLENPATQYGIQMGTAIAGSWFSSIWKSLHSYFDVSNSYVLKKLQLITLPFLSPGEWQQELSSDGLPGSPRFNIQAPDLYIPLMSFITFVLLSGLKSGYSGKFSPSLMGFTASSSIIILFFELIIIYAGFYFLQSALPALLDLVSYCGYVFVPSVIIGALELVLGGQVYWPIFLYFSIAFGSFLVIFM